MLSLSTSNVSLMLPLNLRLGPVVCLCFSNKERSEFFTQMFDPHGVVGAMIREEDRPSLCRRTIHRSFLQRPNFGIYRVDLLLETVVWGYDNREMIITR